MTAPAARAKQPVSLPALRLVEPTDQPNTGCFACPLLCMSSDFEQFKGKYTRNADAILSKLKEPHTVHTRKVSEPWTPVDILFVGEAPGALEDKEGKPFVGGSGAKLRNTIDKFIDTTSVKVGYANVVSCRPPMNRDPAKMEIQACSPELDRQVKARNPKVIVPLGNFSLEHFTGTRGITAVNASVMRCIRPGFEHLKIVPCIHPAFVLRFNHELPRFEKAIELAGRVLVGDYEELATEGDYYVLTDADLIVEVIDAMRRDRLPVAVDTETGDGTPHRDKYPKLLCVSLSNEEGTGYTIPLDHAESPFKDPDNPDRKRVIAALRELFEDPAVEKGGQNIKFDDSHIRYTIGCRIENLAWDTMGEHMCLDDRRGTHGLGTQAVTMTGMGGYHKPLDDYIKKNPECNPDKGGSYSNIPGDVLFPYAGQDADVTLRAHNFMLNDPQWKVHKKLENLAHKYFPKLCRTLAELEYNGAQIDMDVIRSMDVDLTNRMNAAIEGMNALPQVRQFKADMIAKGKHGKRKADPFGFNPGSDRQVGTILFEYYGCRPTELTDTGFTTLAARFTRLSKTNKDLTFGEVIDAAVEKKEWANFSTKADVLHEYERQGVDFAPLVLEYREAQKLHGTYVKPIEEKLDRDGRIHGSFNLTGAATGRLSSNNPNLQQIPPYAKKAYISRFGSHGVILQADYSQIELRVAACLHKDPVMMKAYREGADLHMLTAYVISDMTPAAFDKLKSDDKKWWRMLAKRVNFGIIYGIGPPGLVNTLKREGVFITVEQAKELLHKFFAAHPAMVAALNVLKQYVLKHGYLESFTGRIRRLPEVFNTDEEIRARAIRQAGNFPVQSGAGDMTLMSMCLIDEEIQKRKLQSKLIVTVHDSIVADAHVDELIELAVMMKEIMENIPKLSDRVLPGLDWTWLTVPLVAETECGVSWYHTVEFNPDKVLNGAGSDEKLWWMEGDNNLKYRKPESVDELWELMEQRRMAA